MRSTYMDLLRSYSALPGFFTSPSLRLLLLAYTHYHQTSSHLSQEI